MDTADLKESEKALLYEECERALEEEKKILEKSKCTEIECHPIEFLQ